MTNYFLQLRHLYEDDIKFATAIPRADHVTIFVHQFQEVQREDMNLTYAEYRDYINDHGYAEKTVKGHESKLVRPSVQDEEKAQQATLFDYI